MRVKAGSVGFGKTSKSNTAKNMVIRRKAHKVHTKTPRSAGATLKESYTSQGISIGSYTGLDVNGFETP